LTSSLSNDEDRMVKERSIVDLVELFGVDERGKVDSQTSLEGIVEECIILASDDLKTRFRMYDSEKRISKCPLSHSDV